MGTSRELVEDDCRASEWVVVAASDVEGATEGYGHIFGHYGLFR
jgi:hypothetical protein